MDVTDTSEEFINFALGFRVAAYGASTIRSDESAFLAGKEAGKSFYPTKGLVSKETVRSAYEKWKSE